MRPVARQLIPLFVATAFLSGGVILATLVARSEHPLSRTFATGAVLPPPGPASSAVSPTVGCALDWHPIASPNVVTNTNVFSGVAVLANDDIWAVGSYLDSNDLERPLT